jgi:hypothetical protein
MGFNIGGALSGGLQGFAAGGGWGAAAGAVLGGFGGSATGGGAASGGYGAGAGLTKQQMAQRREDLSSYRGAGEFGITSLQNLLQDPSSYLESPDYQFRLDEGLRGITERAGASGTSLSGGLLRDLTKYSGNLAAGGYNQRIQNLIGLSNMGMQASMQSIDPAFSKTYGILRGMEGEYKSAESIGEFSQMMGVGKDLYSMFGSTGGTTGGGSNAQSATGGMKALGIF